MREKIRDLYARMTQPEAGQQPVHSALKSAIIESDRVFIGIHTDNRMRQEASICFRRMKI